MSAESLPLAKPLQDPRVAMYLKVSQLCIDADTQRPLDHRRIEAMAADWDWRRAEALTVSANGDGTFDVIEGQNRTEALRLIDPECLVLCVVVATGGDPDKAATALGIGKGRRPLTALHQYQLRLVSGDRTARAIQDLVTSKGLRVQQHDGPRATRAVNAMFAIVEGGRGRTTIDDGIGLLDRVFDVVLAAWPTDPHAGRDDRFPADILKAIAEVLVTGYEDKAIVKHLHAKRRGPEYWLGLTNGTSRRQAIVSNLIAAMPALRG